MKVLTGIFEVHLALQDGEAGLRHPRVRHILVQVVGLDAADSLQPRESFITERRAEAGITLERSSCGQATLILGTTLCFGCNPLVL